MTDPSSRINNDAKNSGIDTDIPIVSLSELLEENDEIFNLNESSNQPEKHAVAVVNPTNPLQESDDDIQFVDDVSAKTHVEENKCTEENSAITDQNIIETCDKSENENMEDTQPSVQANTQDDLSAENESISTDSTAVANSVTEQPSTSTNITTESPHTDVVILLDDDDDEEKMEVDPFDELKKTNIPIEATEKSPTENLENPENDDKKPEESENVSQTAQEANSDNVQIESEEIEQTNQIQADEHTDIDSTQLTPPRNVPSIGNDVIMLDDDSPAKASKESETDIKEGKHIYCVEQR